MSPATKGRARRLLRSVQRSVFPEVTSAIVIMAAATWGIFLLVIPNNFPRATLGVTFDWASPAAWGVTMIAGAALFGWVLFVDRRSAQWPAVALVGIFTAWGISAWISVPAGGAPPILSSVLALFCTALGILYFNEAHPEPPRGSP